MHIAVAGNIGSGKTTLTSLLSKHYKWDSHFEDVDENPYLLDFYGDMQRWSFNLQIYYLNSRFAQIQEIKERKSSVIQDRTIYEDAYIFARSLYKQGYFGERDYQNYLTLFESMIRFVQPPDLLIYLQADIGKLVRNIERRGRHYETKIRIDYLKELNEHYENWIDGYDLGRLLIIDVTDIDFINRAEDFSLIIYKIDTELHGLFS